MSDEPVIEKQEEEKKSVIPYIKFKNLNGDKESKPIPAVEVGIKITF